MKKNTLIKYLVSFLVGGVMAFGFMLAKGIFSQSKTLNVISILCDAFFASGVILASVGLIIFASNGGAFDMLAFSMILFFSLFRKNLKRKYKDFYEYREAKKGKKRSLAFLLIVGIFYICVSGIFLIIWTSMEKSL